jgi:C-terminal processing protease CtpA/Prc
MAPIHFVYKKILSTYPFLSTSEKDIFISRATPILKKYPSKITLKEKLTLIRSVLTLLKNGHADLKEAPPYKKFPKKRIKFLEPKITLDKRILIITIPTWRSDLDGIQEKLIKACVKNKNKYDSILIDVRDNTGGDSRIAHSFASIFFQNPISYGVFVTRRKNGKLQKKEAVLKSHQNIYIDVPLTILISGKCFSSNELFLAPFVVGKRAILIGETTRGGSANPLSFEIVVDEAHMIARVPQWRFFLKGKKQPIEKTKIKPNIRYIKSDIIQFAEKQLKKFSK